MYHKGRLPDTPEQLMRSRYSGYVKVSMGVSDGRCGSTSAVSRTCGVSLTALPPGWCRACGSTLWTPPTR